MKYTMSNIIYIISIAALAIGIGFSLMGISEGATTGSEYYNMIMEGVYYEE